MRGRLLLIATTVCLLAGSRSEAVIKADTPLSSIVGHDFVFVGAVEMYYGDKPAMMIAVKESLNGKTPPFTKMPVNLKVDNPETVKKNFIEPLLKRFGPDLEMVFFVKHFGKKFITFGYTNGTWFQLNGTQTAKDQAVFGLVSAEPYFRKTFKGTTPELKKVLKDYFTGAAKLPPLNGKEEPGFGPEYKAKEKGERPTERDELTFLTPVAPGSSFAVIPTVAFAAPLAILAMLFPTVFGGVFVLFRHWVAFITLISINSTLFLLHFFVLPLMVRDSWWNAPSALWFVMTLVTAGCTLWAWRRQLHLLSAGEVDTPPLTELIVLAVMAVSMIGTTLGMWFLAEPSWSNVGWALTVVMTLGVVAGLLYRCWLMVPNETLFAAPSMASEGIIIGTMLLGHVAFVPLLMASNAAGTTEFNENAANTASTIVPAVKKWEFALNDQGFFCASPLVQGDRVYAAAAHASFKRSTFVCLDRHNGTKKWDFIDDGDLQQLISTPCFADGKLYFGEGFHGDPACKVYCVDAATGLKVWDFATKNQTESSPAVANGRLFIGAGNDGLYCFDVKQSIEQKKGVVLWHHPPADYKGRDQRFAAGIRVVGDRLYCGTGVHRDPKYPDKGETAVFSFDCATGKQLWKTEMPYAVWSTPVVKDGFVYVTCGNGDIVGDVDPNEGTPGGALLCLDAQTGKELWRFSTPNGLIDSPAVDAHRIYFGCRDAHLYCIGRSDGKERWKIFLESPVIATPVLDMDPIYERTTSVFAVATLGNICCVNPRTGEIVWSHNLAGLSPHITATPRLVVTRTADGYRRQLYVGAGVGGGRDATAHRAVFYCFEDLVRVD